MTQLTLSFKSITFITMSVVCAIGLLGANRRPKTIVAERFVLKDTQGQARSSLGFDPQGCVRVDLALLMAKAGSSGALCRTGPPRRPCPLRAVLNSRCKPIPGPTRRCRSVPPGNARRLLGILGQGRLPDSPRHGWKDQNQHWCELGFSGFYSRGRLRREGTFVFRRQGGWRAVGVNLFDQKERPRVILAVMPEDATTLMLHDQNAHPRLEMGLDRVGASFLRMSDGQRRARLVAPFDRTPPPACAARPAGAGPALVRGPTAGRRRTHCD